MDTENQTKRTDAAERFTQIILETFRFNGALIAAGDQLTKEFGLTSATWKILGAIQEEPLTMAQIARDKGLTRQSVRRTTALLESRGFVELQENLDHRRARLVTLSEKGGAVLARVTEVQAVWANAIAEGMDPEALAVTLRTLRALSAKL
ncbi:MarR family winged helix-turn-helix transcriptional regulator [Desulfoluna butyratoxydans]|uniref:Marr family n=1 Tax=Desulfoluna butyratoxydans TaxID=231438 RepID=A0A4U8YLT4_9BACT|nr:MarR family transcriptional regulator [Desulfoluna butyratoxydans]VFQ44414.1 marr family [Desulfoluna butyratoxydans]